jgi:hypothetical protein
MVNGCAMVASALRPQGQDHGHEKVDQHRRQGRRRGLGVLHRHEQLQQTVEKGPSHGVDEADEEGGDEGALDRADAADDDYHEGDDDDLVAHADAGLGDRRHHQARQARQDGAERKDQRVQAPDIDSQGAHHGAVRGPGPDQHAQTRVRDHDIQPGRHRQADHDNCQAIGRKNDAGQDFDKAVEKAGKWYGHARRTPDHLHQGVETQNQAEGGQDVIQMITPVQGSDHRQLDHDADHRHRRQGQQDAHEERPGPARQRGAEVGSHHVQ